MSGRSRGGRGTVTKGRYSRLRDGRVSGNIWEALDSGSENGADGRSERAKRRAADQSRDERSREGRNGDRMSVEGEEVMEERENLMEGAAEKEATGGGSGRGEQGKKRSLEERSPGAGENQRVNRKRMDEFEMGAVFDEIVKKMNMDLDELIDKAPDGFKKELRDGLEIMMEGMKGIMNGVSAGVSGERKAREAEEMRTEVKIERIAEEIKVMKEVSEGMVNDRIEQRVRGSEKEMEEKVRIACCNLKVMDIDFGEVTDDRKWMVKTAMSTLRADVYPEDRQMHERIMRRTRVVIMGRRTSATTYKGRSVYTVPVLLECQTKVDAGDLDAILRRVGYFSAFHWPQEILEFVSGVREEVRKMGYKDQTHYVRIRPEEKGGSIQIRADVKEKNGGRFQAKAVWQCPPLKQQLWEGIEGLYEPRMLGGGQRVQSR
jgi:hypothetical protein